MDSSEMFISIPQRYCFISYKPNVFLLFSSLAARREKNGVMVRKFLIRINVSLLLLIIISTFSSCQ